MSENHEALRERVRYFQTGKRVVQQVTFYQDDVATLLSDYDALRAEVERMGAVADSWQEKAEHCAAEIECKEAEWRLQEQLKDKALAVVERLRAALREVYEVWAGSDGFVPATAAEGYQQRLIEQMRDAASRGLSGQQNLVQP